MSEKLRVSESITSPHNMLRMHNRITGIAAEYKKLSWSLFVLLAMQAYSSR